jgi:hypothetical protein
VPAAAVAPQWTEEAHGLLRLASQHRIPVCALKRSTLMNFRRALVK